MTDFELVVEYFREWRGISAESHYPFISLKPIGQFGIEENGRSAWIFPTRGVVMLHQGKRGMGPRCVKQIDLNDEAMSEIREWVIPTT